MSAADDEISLPVGEEAARVVGLLGPQPFQLLSYLSNQLAVIKSQAQMLIGLCGLAVTVTGFSGAHMIRAGWLSSSLLVLGIALIQVAAALCLQTLTETRWVTQSLDDDLVKTTRLVFARRDAQQHRLTIAGRFVGLGLASYLGAVATAAVSTLGG